MARLPVTGADEGVWGDILNEYLKVAHDADGSFKVNTVATQHILNDAVAEAKLAPGVRAKLNATTEVQLRKTATALEWRTSESASWELLVLLADITGPQGAQGADGEQGAQGIQGVPGTPGIQGPKGDTGDAGAQGPAGAKGDKGDTGDTGPQGAAGAQGPQGDPGAQGPQGNPGPGVASGGTTGQVLSKSSGTDYATQWSSITSLLPTAQVTTLTNVTGDGSSTMADAFRIVKITASTACRIRFYRSINDRTADSGRAHTTAPPTDGTLLAEFRWESPATFWTSGFTLNLDAGQNTVYWRVDDGTATIDIEWIRETR